MAFINSINDYNSNARIINYNAVKASLDTVATTYTRSEYYLMEAVMSVLKSVLESFRYSRRRNCWISIFSKTYILICEKVLLTTHDSVKD